MSTVYTAAYRTLVKDQLQDVNNIWSSDQIDDHVLHAIREFSRHVPYMQETLLPVFDDDKEVDISSLSDLVFIEAVEFYPDRSSQFYGDRSDTKEREYRRRGNYLTLFIDFNPEVSEGTLTGTVTFTDASTAVTGSGTLFSTELTAKDNYIKMSTEGTQFYRVRSIESATALTLARPYSGTGGADTVNVTQKRTYKEVCRIYWGGMHSVTTTTTTIETKHEQLITDGAVIYAKRGWLGKAREQIVAAINTIAQASVPISEVTDEITQALADLTSGRSYVATGDAAAIAAAEQIQGVVAKALSLLESGEGYIATQHDEAREAIKKMVDAIRQADVTLAVGEEYIDNVNTGDNVPGSFSTYAASQLGIGQSQLQRAQSLLAQDQPAGELANFASGQLNAAVTLLNEVQAHLSLDQPAGEYLNFATVTLNAVVSRLNQASAYFSEVNSTLNVVSTIYSSQMAEIGQELAIWLNSLRREQKPRVARTLSRAA